MRLRRERTLDGQRWTLDITDYDMQSVPLDKFDHLLLQECSGSDAISDALLALETMARRLEQAERAKPEHSEHCRCHKCDPPKLGSDYGLIEP